MIPEAMSDPKAIRTLIDRDSTTPLSGPELMDFWKACTYEERVFYGSEARSLLATAPQQ